MQNSTNATATTKAEDNALIERFSGFEYGLIVAFILLFFLFASPFIVLWAFGRCLKDDDDEQNNNKKTPKPTPIDVTNVSKMVVKEEHLVDNRDPENELQSSRDADNDDKGQLVDISALGDALDTSLGKGTTRRKLPNECSICLTSYSVGDTVVWSSNPSCSHVFHQHCVFDWILKHRKRICPYCRRDFINPRNGPGYVQTSPPPQIVSIVIDEEHKSQG